MDTSTLTVFPNRQSLPTRTKGFTLIEMVIVVFIIGMLTSAGLPRFKGYMTEQRRNDGRLLLRYNAQILERCMTFGGSYDNNCTLRMDSTEGFYELQVTRTATTYEMKANPTAKIKQNEDTACGSLTLDQNRKQGATGSLPQLCW